MGTRPDFKSSDCYRKVKTPTKSYAVDWLVVLEFCEKVYGIYLEAPKLHVLKVNGAAAPHTKFDAPKPLLVQTMRTFIGRLPM